MSIVCMISVKKFLYTQSFHYIELMSSEKCWYNEQLFRKCKNDFVLKFIKEVGKLWDSVLRW